MCNPLALVSGAVNFFAQAQQAQAAADYQDKVAEQNTAEINANAASANENARYNWYKTNLQEQQQRAAVTNDLLNMQIEKGQNIGTAKAGNLNSGSSFDSLLLDYAGQADRYEGTQEENLKMLGMQAASERFEIGQQAKAQANAISKYIPGNVNGPSLLSLGADLAGSYLTYSSLDSKKNLNLKNTSKRTKYYEEI